MSVNVKWKTRFVMQRKKIGFLHGFAGALVTTLAFGFLHFGVVAGWRKSVTCLLCVVTHV
jgi:hypothetical protein